MTVSMRVVYAGKGYRYLLRSVAVGDGDRKMADPLTRYYSEEGTPPGRWMGTGVSGFGDGQITPGSTVTEAQLVLLLGMGRDPVTGEQLGRAFAKFTSAQRPHRHAHREPQPRPHAAGARGRGRPDRS